MDAKTSEWRPGPSVCRCCLTEGCYKDISTEYFWMGKREVYAEMLSETLNVSISYSQAGGPNSNSRLICEPCISRLRDASDFRRQVVECEKSFMQHLDPCSSMADIEVNLEPLGDGVKLECVKLEKSLSDDDYDDRCDFPDDDDDDDDLDDQPLTKLASRIPKKETVDIIDIPNTTKSAEKRKSTTKIKLTPVKKTKVVKIEPMKAGVSKMPTKVAGKLSTKVGGKAASKTTQKTTEKKKKGDQPQTSHDILETKYASLPIPKSKYVRSARAEARIITKRNATSILKCWTFSPFRWKKNRFKCAYCEAEFTECTELRNHVRYCSTQHSTKDIYSKFKEMPLINVDTTEAVCVYCSIPFLDVTQMRQHVIEHNFDFDTTQPDGVLPFSLNKQSWHCVICFNKFNNFLKLYEHMNVHYQHYICATCGKGYMTAPRLRKHSEVHVSGSFPCNECGRIFTMKAARDSHKAFAHAKGPRYECPHCNMRFNGYYVRMEHMKVAHSEREVSYKCSHCEMTFKTSGKRAIHVRSAHFPPQLDFSCEYCEWQFKTNYELKRHMVRHTGEKNFHCPVCEKSFPRNRALSTHLKTHQDANCKWRNTFKQRLPQLKAHVDLNDLIPSDVKI